MSIYPCDRSVKKWITPLKLRGCGNIDETRSVFGTNNTGTQYQQVYQANSIFCACFPNKFYL